VQKLHLNVHNRYFILYGISMYKFNFDIHYKSIAMNRLKTDSIIRVFQHFEYSYPFWTSIRDIFERYSRNNRCKSATGQIAKHWLIAIATALKFLTVEHTQLDPNNIVLTFCETWPIERIPGSMKFIVVTHFSLILLHFYQLKATRKWLSRALCAEFLQMFLTILYIMNTYKKVIYKILHKF